MTSGSESVNDPLEPVVNTILPRVAIGLAALTGTFNLVLFVLWQWPPDLVAGIGYYCGIILYRRDVSHRALYAGGTVLTSAQLVWFYAVGTQLFIATNDIRGRFTIPIRPPWLGVVDKLVQALLVIVLVALYRMEIESQ